MGIAGYPDTYLAQAIKSLASDDFPAALEQWLKAELRHDNLTILAYFDGHRPMSLFQRAQTRAVHKNFDAVYMAGAYLLDPFHDLHVNRVSSGVYRLSDIAPDQFHRNPYFLDYYSATTIVDELAFISYPATYLSLHICLGRDETSGARFTTREIAVAHRIAPVVVAMAEKQWAGVNAQHAQPNSDVSGHLIQSLKIERGIHLSQRQAEVALLILQGHSSVSIGLKLGISAQTVKVFRKQLYRKCEISSQAQLFQLMLPILTN